METDVWARLVSFYATPGAGASFVPEIGDQVVVGFLENDARLPPILGSLHGGPTAPGGTRADDTNYQKTLTTKAGLRVTLDDDQKVISIATPGNNSITLSDDAKGIVLRNQNHNTLTLNDSGIALTTMDGLVVTATGNIRLNATQNIELSATGDVTAKGLNVEATAQVVFTAKGTATAELSASGQTTIRGTTVAIN